MEKDKRKIKAYNRGKRDDFFWNKKILWMAMLIGLAFVFSYVRLIHFAEGGDITWFSMFFVFLLGYFFGPKGIAAALIFSVLKYFGDYLVTRYLLITFFALDNPVAEAFDYLFSYTIVAAGGLFTPPFWKQDRKKYLKSYQVGKKTELRYLISGYALGMLFRFISSVINFVMFYSRGNILHDVEEGIVYCVGYVGIEAVVTILVLLLPPVHKAVEYCKYVANNEYPFNPENI